MADHRDFRVVVGGVISSDSSDYEVQKLLGSGTYGDVTQCGKVATDEMVTVKILKNCQCIEEAKEEATILQMMKELDKFMPFCFPFSINYSFCK